MAAGDDSTMAAPQTEGQADLQDTPLFNAFGVVLGKQQAPGVWETIGHYLASRKGRRPVLLRLDSEANDWEGASQLDLNLPVESWEQIGCRSNWLDYGVFDTFRDLACTHKAALALEARGICYIGELVTMTEGRLARVRAVDRPAFDAIVERLGRAGLRLGQRVGPRACASQACGARPPRFVVVA